MSFEPHTPGTLLSGRYRIVRLIRAGGMGAAYESQDQGRSGKLVVVKELTDIFESHEERQVGIRNFLTEVQVLASLLHPNIPRMLDHFFDGDHFYFVMELIDGVDLGSMLNERGRVGFTPEEVVGWGADVCRVLEYIHAMTPPLVHRDLKPSNLIRRNRDGKLFVIDFGIARVALPEEGKMIGSLGYASPEQHENRLEPRSDIYSLGVTLHELLTGVKPEPYQFDFVPPSTLQPGISSELSECVMRALAYYPEERWENATQFREAIEALQEYHASLLTANNSSENMDEEYIFALAVRDYCSMHLALLLEEIRMKFPNECQISLVPKEFVYFEFVLGMITPFKLIISVNEDSREVLFLEQDGLLPPRLIGKINPMLKDAWREDESILQTFISHFKETNSAGGFSLFS